MVPWISVAFMVFLNLQGTESGVCSGDSNGFTYVGEWDIEKHSKDLDSDTGLMILLDHSDYEFDCCGFLREWFFAAHKDHKSSTVSFDAQVWRPDSANSWTLVGSNTLTASNADKEENAPITAGNRIRVNNNDVMGIHNTGAFVVGYKDNGSNQKRLTGRTSTVADGTSIDWSTAGVNDRTYAIGAYVTGGLSPHFTSTQADITKYNDEVSVNDVLSTITTSDNDPEDVGSLTLTLISSTNSGLIYFEIPTGTSNIAAKSVPIPVNTYDLQLKVEDPCTKSATDTLKVIILNRVPVMHDLPDSANINEDIAANTLIHIFSSTDSVTDPVTCAMKTGDTNAFKVESIPATSTYGIYTNNPGITFDHDTKSSYTVTAECDDGDDKVTGQLSITVVPNQAPVIVSLPNSTSISEDANTNTLLHTLTVTDAEGDTVTCVLNPTSTIFDVSLIPPTNTGYGVYLTGGTALDYDTTSTYTVTVECNDHRRGNTGTFTINLIRNEPPVITSLPNSASISEDLTTKTLLHTLTYTDNENDDVTCTLVNFNSRFLIEKIAPALVDYGIFTKNSVTFNYDNRNTFSVKVRCSDQRRYDQATLTVNIIKNEPPSITNLPMSCEIPETTKIETVLYTVTVSDPTNDTVICSITTVTTIFYLQVGSNQYEYKIYVRSGQNFDYDIQRQYTLDIKCEDARRSVTDIFYIYLLRNKEPFFINIQGMTTVSSQSPFGQIVFTITGGDPENDQLQFSMSSSDLNVPFMVDQNTGDVQVTRSITNEAVTGYDLFVNVTDGRNTVGPETLTVLISDINSPPSFTRLPLTASVFEGTEVGSSIFMPTVLDQDTMDIHSYFAVFSPPDGAIYFKINGTTGEVTSKTIINFETISDTTFLLTITVSDGSMDGTENLTINIIDMNEPPVFTKKYYSLSGSENVAGTQLQDPFYQYEDQDGDTILFTLDCDTNTGLLNIDSSTGLLAYSIDYVLDNSGLPDQLNCQVTISDGQYTDVAYINISISNNNGYTPKFEHDRYTFFVDLETGIGTNLGQIVAIDNDIGTYGEVLYHLVQEDFNDGLFSIGNNGSITLLKSLSDFGEGSVVNLTVYAVDVGGLQDSTLVYFVILAKTVPKMEPDNIQYFTFFSYARNMAWFVPLMFVIVGTFGVLIHTIYKGYCKCNTKRLPTRPRRVRRRY